VEYELGVLFVHGVGNQRQGDTLVRWGEAIDQWVTDWCAGSEMPVTVVFRDVHLHPSGPEPAHGELRIVGEPGASAWVLAEAWWADEVRTPRYRDLAMWGVRALPLALLLQVVGRARRSLTDNQGHGRPRKVIALAYWASVGLITMVVLAPLVVLAIVAMLVIGLLPVPAVRRGVATVQRGLTGTVGDSLVLLDSPMQAAAMAGRVEAGVGYLRDRGCRRVVVIAHSQGAELAAYALADEEVEPVDGLLTVGSGITTLQILNARGWTLLPWLPAGLVLVAAALGIQLWLAAHASGVRWSHVGLGLLWLLGAIVVFALVLLLVRRYLDGHRSEMPIALVAVFVTLGLVIVPAQWLLGGFAFPVFMLYPLLGIFVLSVRRIVSVKPPLVEPDLKGATRAWLDLYAHSDPVPNGPTLTREPGWPLTREVHNLDSVISDHSSYLAARDDALASIVAFLLEHCESSPVDVNVSDTLVLRRAAAYRRFRLRRLRWTRRIVTVAALLFLTRTWAQLGPWTSGISLRVAHAAGPLGGLLPWKGQPRAAAATAIGAVGVAVVAALLYWVAFLIWQAWDREAFRRMIHREPKIESKLHQRLLVAWWGLVIYLALVGDYWVLELTRPAATFGDRFATVLSPLGFMLIAVGIYVVVVARRRRRVGSAGDTSSDAAPTALGGIPRTSPDVAGYGLMWRSAAPAVAGRGPASPSICRRLSARLSPALHVVGCTEVRVRAPVGQAAEVYIYAFPHFG
jgi:hypothetical protein